MISMRALMPLALLLIAGCSATPAIEYRAVPPWLIPPPPELPSIPSSDLTCLSDDAYFALAKRDRERDAYARQLRALLEAQ